MFFIADKKGYFKAEGLAATMTSFASAAKMIAPLGTGQLDVGGGTVAAGLYNAVERGINIKIVADKASIKDGYEYSTLLVRKDLADSGTLQVARRPQGHDDRDRLAGGGLGILAQRGAQEGRAEVHRRQRGLHGLPRDARRVQEQGHRRRRHQRADRDAVDRAGVRGAGEPAHDLSRPADRGRALCRRVHQAARRGAEVHERVSQGAARLQRCLEGRTPGRAGGGGGHRDPQRVHPHQGPEGLSRHDAVRRQSGRPRQQGDAAERLRLLQRPRADQRARDGRSGDRQLVRQRGGAAVRGYKPKS